MYKWALLARYVYTYEEFVIVTEAPQCNRMTATGQDTDNKRIIYNIQIGNVQNSKNTIYNIDNYVCTGLICANLKCKNKYVWWINNVNSVVCSMLNVKCSWDGLPEGRNCSCVWSFGAQCSVASTRRQQFKEGVCWMWWGPEWFCQLTLDKYSSWRVGRVVPMIRSAVRTTLRSLLWSDLVAEMNQTVIDGFNDGRVELFQQLMWQVEIPQLAKDVQPLLGLFHNGLNVIVPLQVLRNCGAQESGWLHCSHSAVHDGEWGRAGGFLLKSTIISTVLSMLSSRLLRL